MFWKYASFSILKQSGAVNSDQNTILCFDVRKNKN